MKIIFITILLMCFGCSCIPYKSDSGLVSSASANVDVFPVKINGQYCKSNNGVGGLCALSINRNVVTTVDILPLPYDYEITFDCTNALNFDIKESVLKETHKKYVISDYSGISETYYCKCEIYRIDKKKIKRIL